MTRVSCFTVGFFSVLQAEDEFRDKLSPIVISLNFSLDPRAPVDQTGLRPVLNYQTEQLIEQKVCILLTRHCIKPLKILHCVIFFKNVSGVSMF